VFEAEDEFYEDKNQSCETEFMKIRSEGIIEDHSAIPSSPVGFTPARGLFSHFSLQQISENLFCR
jgi:hypothetical protein